MQPERPLSIAVTGIAVALIVPQYLALSHHQGAVPGNSVLVGGILGALGVYAGTLMASDFAARPTRVTGYVFCLLLALAFCGAPLLAALYSPGWGRSMMFGLAAILPWLGPAAVYRRLRR